MIDQGENDDKIIAVHVDDPEYEHYHSINELPPHCLKILRRFLKIINSWRTRKSKSTVFWGRARPKKPLPTRWLFMNHAKKN